jgi:hypothetical protein
MRAIDGCLSTRRLRAPTNRSSIGLCTAYAVGIRCISSFSRAETRFGGLPAHTAGVLAPAFSWRSSNPPLTPPSPPPRPPDAFACEEARARPRSLLPPPREKERLRRPKAPSIDRLPRTASTLASTPFIGTLSVSRFGHRNPTPDVASPGAVPRFGLAPVHTLVKSDHFRDHDWDHQHASLGIDCRRTTSADVRRFMDTPDESFRPRTCARRSETRSPRTPLRADFGAASRT